MLRKTKNEPRGSAKVLIFVKLEPPTIFLAPGSSVEKKFQLLNLFIEPSSQWAQGLSLGKIREKDLRKNEGRAWGVRGITVVLGSKRPRK